MLPKPVTAFALSAIISIASFTASSAVAAPSTSPDSSSSVAPPAKPSHHVKKKAKSKKLPPLASLHSAEPKSSPKLPASHTSPLDLKNVKDKSHASSKKSTIAATGKEVFIGGPTGHGKSDPKSAKGSLALAHGSKGPMSKSGRAPSRPDTNASKADGADNGTDDHPIPVALRGLGKLGAKAPSPPCLRDPIEFVRGPETERFAMTSCDGGPAPLATERLSVLVRPDSAVQPASLAALAKVQGPELAPGVRRIDPGLLTRLQAITDHFAKPGVSERISIISGYRPGSAGSFHASAQALDFHLEGVANEALVDFCKTLENTGCGYYPNSSFVHVDVRAPGTGHVAWIDASGPGEPPRYVPSWPPPPEADVKLADADQEEDRENPYKESLPALPGDGDMRSPAASTSVPLRLKDWE
jgi:hypothetical protein